MTFTEKSNRIFWNVCLDYHKRNSVDACMQNPYKTSTIEYLLYKKCWIDTIKCHLENKLRNPDIEPITALYIEKRIEKSNQDRINLIEIIDNYFRDKYKDADAVNGTTDASQSPALALDRLSVLALKIYHMKQEVERTDVSAEHIQKCKTKLEVLIEQRTALSAEIENLLNGIEAGRQDN